ncbi:helix-turn-helix domain-containing protein [Geminisphaera colitermitum]|uniref:helix-turn-helix domain-containing protein n=1 Tax=Geminisphaera colitermitum TaxID=1148786 RepID=UPI0005BD2C6E|nr:helix-turn-helix transcriptional regulator [Geminisphaera colitermitum]
MKPSTKKLELTSRGILTFRESLGLTQEELGRRLDISGNYVWMLETNKKPISGKIARKLRDLEAGRLGGDADELEKWRRRALTAEETLRTVRRQLETVLSTLKKI